jgi:NAD(P)-dependent dehydrogenase (short-subunit alcohol dehydrogenase family)
MNILITGGASGLGGAITKSLAQEPGNMVFFTYNRSAQKAEDIASASKNAIPIKCDFENEAELQSFVSKIGGYDLDVLINNAYSGEFLKKHFHKIAPADFLADFKRNIIPTIAITQTAIENFRQKRRGRIITILTSALINTPPIGSSVYLGNKAYLEKLTKIWATENAKFNISSNSVSPSFMQTDMTAGFDERVVSQMVETHPLKKLLSVEDVAETIRFLVSASPQLNGVDILLNAATSMR